MAVLYSIALILSFILSLTSEGLMKRDSACESFFISSGVYAAFRVILNLKKKKRKRTKNEIMSV